MMPKDGYCLMCGKLRALTEASICMQCARDESDRMRRKRIRPRAHRPGGNGVSFKERDEHFEW